MPTLRRDFFRAFTKPLQKEEATPLKLRPPYGFSESLFENECLECDLKDCVEACDEKIITIINGRPELNFSKSGCTFCDECANACEEGVLSLDNSHTSEHLNARFKISLEACVAHHGVICFSCKEPCIDDAILFNGMFNPIIDTDKCTACGFCLSRCPTLAIEYEVLAIKEFENNREVAR